MFGEIGGRIALYGLQHMTDFFAPLVHATDPGRHNIDLVLLRLVIKYRRCSYDTA